MYNNIIEVIKIRNSIRIILASIYLGTNLFMNNNYFKTEDTTSNLENKIMFDTIEFVSQNEKRDYKYGTTNKILDTHVGILEGSNNIYMGHNNNIFGILHTLNENDKINIYNGFIKTEYHVYKKIIIKPTDYTYFNSHKDKTFLVTCNKDDSERLLVILKEI